MTSHSSPPSLHSPEETPTIHARDVGIAIARKKKAQQQQHEMKQKANTNTSLRDFVCGASLYIACLALPTLLGLTGFFGNEQESISEMAEESYYEQASNYVCENLWSYWCTPQERDESILSVPVHAPDAEWSDVGIVAVLSLSMAVIRLLLVHLLVPRYLASPIRLEALVRCKSVSLLSSSYQKTLTPQASKRKLNIQDDSGAIPPPPLFAEEQLVEPEGDALSNSLHEVRKSVESLISTGRRSAGRVLGVELRAPYDGDELQDTDRLFTAPRYATAVFRLVYCIWSCTCAFLWLREQEFFPPSVGGNGATVNCWDLKGGVALETSADFDDANAVLRKYFLVQASYHLHSWATHVMSLMALVWYKTSLVTIRKSMVSYWRALLQHLLALAMIGGCYFFSSLRRLGAIGIFALDVSSLFVHLLQLCINAPPNSWWHQPKVIFWIHRGLVIPIFLYTRFYVFPFVVWYSSIYESKDWLLQMERTLFPGSAQAMKLIFHGFLIVNVALNLVAFRRLLFHPHLHSVTSKARTQASAREQ
jgi:hypothetical protein